MPQDEGGQVQEALDNSRRELHETIETAKATVEVGKQNALGELQRGWRTIRTVDETLRYVQSLNR